MKRSTARVSQTLQTASRVLYACIVVSKLWLLQLYVFRTVHKVDVSSCISQQMHTCEVFLKDFVTLL